MGKKKPWTTLLNTEHAYETVGIGDFMSYGSGNPDSGFTEAFNFKSDITAGIKAKYRQGDDIAGTIDKKGIIHYDVPAGTQVVDPEHGVPVANAGRAAWSWDYYVNSDAEGSLLDLDHFRWVLEVDIDPTKKTRFEKFYLDEDGSGSSGYRWASARNGATFIGDDAGDGQESSNSHNVAFDLAQLIGDIDRKTPGLQLYDFSAGAIFDVKLSAYSLTTKHNGHVKVGNDPLLSLHAQFHVVDDLIV